LLLPSSFHVSLNIIEPITSAFLGAIRIGEHIVEPDSEISDNSKLVSGETPLSVVEVSKTRVQDMPADLTHEEKVNWIDGHALKWIQEGVPWRLEVPKLVPGYFNRPYGRAYGLHDLYINGPIAAYRKEVDFCRDIVPFALPDDIILQSLDGNHKIPREKFLIELARAIRKDPTLRFQKVLAPDGISWRTGLGSQGLMINMNPVVRAMQDWLHQCIALYQARPREMLSPTLLKLGGRGARMNSFWGHAHLKAGKEVPHIHRDGFISGVFYVRLPSELSALSNKSQNGCLRFGESLIDVPSPNHKELTLKPVEGCLFVFPGYIPHRILEFGPTAEPRISISFDAL
jgi:hypothetical protein